MDEEIETLAHDRYKPVHAFQAVADGLPALGIVAAVLGIIHAMGALDQSPEILGELIGAALVGTFAGIFLSYAILAPIAQKSGRSGKAALLFTLVKRSLLAFMNGPMPQVAVEFGRKTIPSKERPTIDVVENETTPAGRRRARDQRGSLMAQSRGCFESGLEGRAGMEDGPEDVHAPSCEGDDGLVVAFTLASLAFVEGSAVVMVKRAECGLVEDAFESLVAAVGPSEEAGSARLAQHRRHAGSGSERVGGAEAGEVSCLGDEFCGKHGPHAGQAADEGRVRVALKHRLQFAVELDEARAAAERLDGEFADQPRGHALGRDGDGLLSRDGQHAIGKVLDLRQAAGCLQVAHQTFFASGAQLGGCNELGQQVQRSFGLEVEAGFQARKDADKQVSHAGKALGLRLHDVAATADQQPDLEIEFGSRLDLAQVRSGSDLIGNGAGVARVGLVLAADRALTSAIDSNTRHVDEREPSLGQHGFGQTCNAADDIQADADCATQSGELVDQRRNIGRRVGQFAIDLHDAVGVDGSDPVDFFGDVNSDAGLHGAPLQFVTRHPAHAVFALHSDGSQSLISGRGGVAAPGELPPEPS